MDVKTTIPTETSRYNNLPKLLKLVFFILVSAGIALVIAYIFNFTFHGRAFINTSYYYLLFSFFSPCVFLILPARKRDKRIPWYDILASALVFGIPGYFFLHGWEIVQVGWVPPSTFNFVLAFVFCILVLEGGRRTGGPAYLFVCLIVGAYPLFANHLPAPFYGINYPFKDVIGLHVFGGEGLIGLPAKVMGEIIIGFLIFAGVLIYSGGGEFFLRIAMALLGRYRGGAAKVAVVSSAFFGSLSGSALSNVVATGSITIPTMKRTGYPPHYAAAIEACASAGGVLMPPIMGAVAFVMCVVLNIEYVTIISAAAIPSALYYFGLLMQVDGYAARVGLRGLPREDLPSLKQTLKEGWPFIAVFVFLLWGLIYMRWEAMSPFYASGLMFFLSFFRRDTMLTPRRIVGAILRIGQLISQTLAIILPLGFVVNGLTVTGVAGSITAGLVNLAGGHLFLLLLIAAITCYLLGMAGLIVPAYIFLSVSMAPAVLEIAPHLNVLAVHLFIIYFAMLAMITPPVAAGAFLAATIAGANPMKTAFISTRLGFVKYFIPFLFVMSPSLVLQGPIVRTIIFAPCCFLGVLLIAAGLEGYLLLVGTVRWMLRSFLVIAGVLIAFPEGITTFIGTALAVLAILMSKWRRKRLLNPTEMS